MMKLSIAIAAGRNLAIFTLYLLFKKKVQNKIFNHPFIFLYSSPPVHALDFCLHITFIFQKLWKCPGGRVTSNHIIRKAKTYIIIVDQYILKLQSYFPSVFYDFISVKPDLGRAILSKVKAHPYHYILYCSVKLSSQAQSKFEPQLKGQNIVF